MSGLLIAVCGLDGAGKTTQISLLNDWFLIKGKKILLTKQPTDYYRNDTRVREYLDHGICPNMKAIALLSAADRTWHMAKEIEPALHNGVHVISDRYIYSSYAFFRTRGLDYDYLDNIYGTLKKPDLTIFLDLEPEITLKRVMERDGNENMKYEEKDTKVFEQVRSSFLEVLPKDTLFINGALEKNTIHEQIVHRVGILLETRLVP
ncbi:dTMP kinase [Paenibacillus beijingensis]|uniref:Thymidylate kinase n=1 Tax=Paenibacillus beijingensis TaxID=1126833 RepID=A0A0D5NEC9_9BACL|nr:dTMP kinase [Paenibacillus beijingensis]AJY73322.1 hypothetical protein VN24_00105 [Paenibacillus beijingensis]